MHGNVPRLCRSNILQVCITVCLNLKQIWRTQRPNESHFNTFWGRLFEHLSPFNKCYNIPMVWNVLRLFICVKWSDMKRNMLRYVRVLIKIMSCHVAACYVMSRVMCHVSTHVTLRPVTSRHITSRHIISHSILHFCLFTLQTLSSMLWRIQRAEWHLCRRNVIVGVWGDILQLGSYWDSCEVQQYGLGSHPRPCAARNRLSTCERGTNLPIQIDRITPFIVEYTTDVQCTQRICAHFP